MYRLSLGSVLRSLSLKNFAQGCRHFLGGNLNVSTVKSAQRTLLSVGPIWKWDTESFVDGVGQIGSNVEHPHAWMRPYTIGNFESVGYNEAIEGGAGFI